MGHSGRLGVLVGFVLLISMLLLSQPTKEKHVVSVDEARALIAKDSTVLVLDVRTREEYTGELGHIDRAVLIPVQELEKRIDELEPYKGKTILAVCRTGRRSANATEILTKSGFKAMNVEGGMVKWNEKKMPVVREKKQAD